MPGFRPSRTKYCVLRTSFDFEMHHSATLWGTLHMYYVTACTLPWDRRHTNDDGMLNHQLPRQWNALAHTRSGFRRRPVLLAAILRGRCRSDPDRPRPVVEIRGVSGPADNSFELGRLGQVPRQLSPVSSTWLSKPFSNPSAFFVDADQAQI